MKRRQSSRVAVVLLGALAVASGCSDDPAVDLDWHTDLASAQSEARSSGRPILTNFTGSDWCGWCVKLHDEVFSKPEFASWAADRVVLLELDFPRHSPQPAALREQNRTLQQRYGIRGFPSILILDAEGTVLDSLGYVAGGPSAWIARAERSLGERTGR